MKTPTINRILVPVDPDNLSLEIINLVIAMSQRHKAEIRLLHVINPEQYAFIPVDGLAVSVPREEAIKTDTQRLQQWASATLSDQAFSYTVECRTGGLAVRIVDAATDLKADLIVMSKPGTSGLLQYMIGSEAYYVIKHAPCSVMTVPEHASVRDFHQILFPLRTVQGVETKYDFARTIVRQNNAHLTILGLHNQHDHEEGKVLNGKLALLKKWTMEDSIETDMLLSETDSAVNTVLQQAEEQKADLIIITADSAANVRQLFTGPFFKQIISRATIPVLSIKPQTAVLENCHPVKETLVTQFSKTV
ncbi:universal stress protein [Spirosoma sp. HMF3257]|uniref:Universal stress protein n=1 Tax=Spirosoma telluris TaxID=2183553 RepID=A0A327NVB2_9BACT|nr:universal stress protein [Spirosoma telluris]RAI77946.1 universal stress protein [Spirosoma telluris]